MLVKRQRRPLSEAASFAAKLERPMEKLLIYLALNIRMLGAEIIHTVEGHGKVHLVGVVRLELGLHNLPEEVLQANTCKFYIEPHAG